MLAFLLWNLDISFEDSPMKPSAKNANPELLVVNEIFCSIQGESTHAGRRCVFVRLTYCNLRCSYCDTAYAFEEGKAMEVDDVVDAVCRYGCKLVEITGGEPLYQSNVHRLMKRLCDEDFEVLLETGGSLSIAEVDPRMKRIVDFKCPSSGMEKRNLWENVNHLRSTDEVKFVIGVWEDYDWAKRMIEDRGIRRHCSVLMSVVFGQLEPAQLAEWILEDRLDVRLQLQVHKYIWPPDMRGV